MSKINTFPLRSVLKSSHRFLAFDEADLSESPDGTTVLIDGAVLIAVINAAEAATKMQRRARTGANEVLALADINAGITMDRATANELLIQPNATENIPDEAVTNVIQIGAGQTTIRAAAGVTINGVDAGSVVIAGRWNGVALWQMATNVWIASGALA